MKEKLLTAVLIFLITTVASGQDFTGQWKGTFRDNSSSVSGWGNSQCDYVLELDVNGTNVSGYSYTYFTDEGKKYYTICSLKGFIDKKQQYIEIKEYLRTKTNVPNNIRNCFQVHKLTYRKMDDTETLKGEWVPAPDQEGGCGYGVTSLQRRVLKKNYSLYNPVSKAAPNTSNKKLPILSDKNKKNNLAVKQTPKKNDWVLKSKTQAVQEPFEMTPVQKNTRDKIICPPPNFDKRNNNLIKTIEVENAVVKVDLYDNGEIDGDSISLFYNGKLLISHKRLSEKPITLNIKVDKDNSMNELVMYAENLGTIPPNTALMVVTDGSKRYEVRITSDLRKSGTIHFALKPDEAGK